MKKILSLCLAAAFLIVSLSVLVQPALAATTGTCGDSYMADCVDTVDHKYQNGRCVYCSNTAQPGDGWGNWSDYVDVDTVVIYPVEGGNLYFGQESFWSSSEKAWMIYLVSADSTITNAILPETVNGLSVTGIATAAFAYCTSIVKVYIPASVYVIGDWPFLGCGNLTEITVAQDNAEYFSDDGVLYSNDGEYISLFAYPAGRTEKNYTICDGTTDISYYAFSGATNLVSIAIPSSVSYIDHCAFEDCVKLTDIYYAGTEAQWRQIRIWCNDPAFLNATIHYNSTGADEVEGLLGDVNGDGKVDTTDAKLIMQFDLGIADETVLDLALADVNGDGKANTTDAKLIMQLDLGLIEQFP